MCVCVCCLCLYTKQSKAKQNLSVYKAQQMEQAAAQYWMLMKRKQDIVVSDVPTCKGGSWEERAFAEDHAAVMWPPRSYSCTFCNREFRSAQALGGHMNVHRRDRARLKQSSPPTNLVASTSPLPPPPPPRVSSDNPCYDHHQPLFSSSHRSWSGAGGAIKFMRVSDSTRGHDEDGEELDLSVGLNCSSQSIVMGCKRPKLAPSPSLSLDFFLKPCLQAAEMHIGFKASSIEDLDLELRLGHDPPQVK